MKQLTFPHGLIARRRRTLSVLAHGNPHRLNLAVKLALLLTVGFIAALTLMRLVATTVHPAGFTSALAPYQAMQPGIRLADIRPFACGPHYFLHETREEQCDLNQVGVNLRRVTLTLQGGKVSKVTIIGNGLRVGDLVQLWGRPDSSTDKNGGLSLHWEGGIQAITQGRNGFSFHLPIKLVVLS